MPTPALKHSLFIKFTIMTKIYTLFTLLALVAMGCTKTDEALLGCGNPVLIDIEKYNNRTHQDSFLNIIETPVISNNCLTLVVGYSGCNGKHDLELINDGSIAESLPVQTSLRLIDKKTELCDAYFTDTYEFDLTSLKERFKNENKVQLNFPDQAKSILWEIQ
jgi:hypothetical protein